MSSDPEPITCPICSAALSASDANEHVNLHLDQEQAHPRLPIPPTSLDQTPLPPPPPPAPDASSEPAIRHPIVPSLASVGGGARALWDECCKDRSFWPGLIPKDLHWLISRYIAPKIAIFVFSEKNTERLVIPDNLPASASQLSNTLLPDKPEPWHEFGVGINRLRYGACEVRTSAGSVIAFVGGGRRSGDNRLQCDWLSVAISSIPEAGSPEASVRSAIPLPESATGEFSLPDLPCGRSSSELVSIGDTVFVLGGFLSEPKRRLDDNRRDAKCARVGAAEWVDICPMLKPRPYFATVRLTMPQSMSTIVAVGGGGTDALTTAEQYDPLDDRWTQLPSMDEQYWSFPGTVLHNRVHIFGGEHRGHSSSRTAHCALDVRTDAWTKLQNVPEPFPHGGAAAVPESSYIVLTGGEMRHSKTHSNVWVYDNVADRFCVTEEKFPWISMKRQENATGACRMVAVHLE